MKNLVLVVLSVNILCCAGEDLHLIEPKPGICYDVYATDQPIFLSKSVKSCTGFLPEIDNCLGLKTHKNETIVLDCKGGQKSKPGCYKIINPDKTEGTVCQTLDEARGCEIITTPMSLYVEVFCHPVEAGEARIISVKSLRPPRT